MLTKETLDSWFTPKEPKYRKLTVTSDAMEYPIDISNLTEEEELVAECDMCHGTGEVTTYYRDEDTGYNWVADDVKPCVCQHESEF